MLGPSFEFELGLAGHPLYQLQKWITGHLETRVGAAMTDFYTIGQDSGTVDPITQR
jgi:hypothetical protein